MASPQLENGYTQIANELYDAILQWRFSSYEFRVLIFIIRKTYGWGKKTDWISLSQFVSATNIKRTHICRTLNLLNKQNIITKRGNRNKPLYGINKDYDLWIPLPKGVRSHHKLKGGNPTSTKGGNKVVAKGVHTKETIQKKLYTKESVISKDITPIDYELSTLLIEEIKKNLPTFKEPNLDTWANHISRMRRLDNRTPEQIKYLIEWCQQDNFWQANILSTKKLREKFDTLVAQVKRNKSSNKGITII